MPVNIPKTHKILYGSGDGPDPSLNASWAGWPWSDSNVFQAAVVYKHGGRAYCYGQIWWNNIGYATSEVLRPDHLLPPALRPLAPFTFNARQDATSFLFDPVYLGKSIQFTVHPDGRITCDDANKLNGYFSHSLIIDGISWPIASGSHSSPAWSNFPPAMLGWVQNGARTGKHPGRIHLEGQLVSPGPEIPGSRDWPSELVYGPWYTGPGATGAGVPNPPEGMYVINMIPCSNGRYYRMVNFTDQTLRIYASAAPDHCPVAEDYDDNLIYGEWTDTPVAGGYNFKLANPIGDYPGSGEHVGSINTMLDVLVSGSAIMYIVRYKGPNDYYAVRVIRENTNGVFDGVALYLVKVQGGVEQTKLLDLASITDPVYVYQPTHTFSYSPGGLSVFERTSDGATVLSVPRFGRTTDYVESSIFTGPPITGGGLAGKAERLTGRGRGCNIWYGTEAGPPEGAILTMDGCGWPIKDPELMFMMVV